MCFQGQWNRRARGPTFCLVFKLLVYIHKVAIEPIGTNRMTQTFFKNHLAIANGIDIISPIVYWQYYVVSTNYKDLL